jgi:hypothetical protein
VKQKDLVYLVIAVVIILVAGYVVYLNLAPKNSAGSEVKVNIVGAIPSEMDSEGQKSLADPTKTKDYSSPIEFTGLNNAAPFGK